MLLLLAADETELSSDFGGTTFDKSDFMLFYTTTTSLELDVIREWKGDTTRDDGYVYVDAHT